MKALITVKKNVLTAAQFKKLADVPPELEWLANITNEKTCRAYKIAVSEFSEFLGLRKPEDFRSVTRAHVMAWREMLEGQELSGPTPAQAFGAVLAVRLSL